MKAHGTRGFTLVELMTVVAIVGILAGISITFGLQQYERAQQRSYVQQWLGGLAFARAESMRRGTAVAVSCVNRSDMLIFIDSNLNGVLDSSEETLRFVPAPRDDLACATDFTGSSDNNALLYYTASGQLADTHNDIMPGFLFLKSSTLLILGKNPIQRSPRGVVGNWNRGITIRQNGALY